MSSKGSDDKSTLHADFNRDINFLRNNMQPLEQSGKKIEKLDYEGNAQECLSDAMVQELAKALLCNDKFCGSVKLDKNGLTDLAVLAIADVLRKPEHQNITKLSLEGNEALTCKAGEYVGQALIDNYDKSILRELDFSDIDLGTRGLIRVIDAANKTPALEKLNVGVLTDNALLLLAERLEPNQHLLELKFAETCDH